MTETCDLCRSSALEPVYRPTAGGRGLTVHLCSDCGLVQSLPRRSHAPGRRYLERRRFARMTHGLRTEACLSLIARKQFERMFGAYSTSAPTGAPSRVPCFAAAPEALLTCVDPTNACPMRTPGWREPNGSPHRSRISAFPMPHRLVPAARSTTHFRREHAERSLARVEAGRIADHRCAEHRGDRQRHNRGRMVHRPAPLSFFARDAGAASRILRL